MGQKKITKKDIVDSIYENTKYEKLVVQQILEHFLLEIKKSLNDKATIELRGFGTFELRLRKRREVVRNPRTGEKSSMPSHYVAVFRSGKELKKSLSEILPTTN